MLSQIFKETEEIRVNSEIYITLDFGNDMKHDVIAIPIIQFFIGDRARSNLSCGWYGGHSLQMNGLCRDCDIHPLDGDTTRIGHDLTCSFHQKG